MYCAYPEHHKNKALDEYFTSIHSGNTEFNHAEMLYLCGVDVGNNILSKKALNKTKPCRILTLVEDAEHFTRGLYEALGAEIEVQVGVYWVYPNIINPDFKVSRIIHQFTEWGKICCVDQVVVASSFALDQEVLRSMIVNNLEQMDVNSKLLLASVIVPDQVHDELLSEFAPELVKSVVTTQVAQFGYLGKSCIEAWKMAAKNVYSALGLFSNSDRLVYMPDFVKNRVNQC
jgi:hypothetical protein